MSQTNLPLALYEANAVLQADITALLQKNGLSWFDAAQKLGSDGLAQSTTQIGDWINAGDWQALMAQPSQLFWRALQSQMGESNTLAQTAIHSQIAFINGLQQALAEWQQSVSGAFASRSDAAAFADVFQQWGPPWAKDDPPG